MNLLVDFEEQDLANLQMEQWMFVPPHLELVSARIPALTGSEDNREGLS